MNDPWDGIWDRPEIGEGDEDSNITYAAVGRALSSWENLEFHFSVLYSLFRGSPHNFELITEYGLTGRIFEERMIALSKAAETFFVSFCNQSAEGEFSWELFAARKLATRRNEIAHGIVDALHLDLGLHQQDADGFTKLTPRYFVVPPHYAKLRYSTEGNFFYGSVELDLFAENFQRLLRRVSGFVEILERAS